MSRTVDELVATARFENGQFEQAVQTSIGTLEKLKAALKFGNSAKSLEEMSSAANKMDFSKAISATETLAKRFSTIGVVGMTVTQDLTRFAERSITKIFNRIAEGGKRRAMNVENAHFMLQGLLKDEEKVQAIMDDARQSVADTAYGYDEAAKAASSFAASGLQAGEQMYTALAAITGVAAMTNANYESISQIFTTVAGNGRLMGDQLLQLSSRGLNAAATIADYFNAVNSGSTDASESLKTAIAELTEGMSVTEADIREWVSRGKISFDMFANSMSDAFAEHAKDANKTLNGVLSNVGARFSQIGEKFVTPLIKQEGPLVTFFNTIKDQLAAVRDNIQPLADLFTGSVIKALDYANTYIGNINVAGFFGEFNKLVAKAEQALNPFSTVTREMIENLGLTETQFSVFEKAIINTARSHGIAIDQMIDKEGSFLDTLTRGWLSLDIFKEALGLTTDEETEAAKQTVANIEEIRKAALDTIRGDYGNGSDRFSALTEAGFDPDLVQHYVDKIHELTNGTWDYDDAILATAESELNLVESIDKMSDKQLEVKGYTEEEIEALHSLQAMAKESGSTLEDMLTQSASPWFGVKLVMDSVSNVLSGLWSIVGAVKDAFFEVFPPSLLPKATVLLLKINELSKSFKLSDETVDKLRRTFRGFFSIVSIVIKVLTAIGSVVLPIVGIAVSFVADKFLWITAKIGDFLFWLNNAIDDLGVWRKVSDLSENATSAFGGAIGWLSGKITEYSNKIKKFVSEHDLLNKAVQKITEWAEKASTKFSEFKKVVSEKVVTPAMTKLTEWFDNLKAKLPSFETVKNTVVGFFSDLANKITDPAFIEKWKNRASSAFNSITSTFGFLKDTLAQNVVFPAIDKIREFIPWVSERIPDIDTVKNSFSDLLSTFSSDNGFPVFDKISGFFSQFFGRGSSETASEVKETTNSLSEDFKMPGFQNALDVLDKLKEKLPVIDDATDKTEKFTDVVSAKVSFFGLDDFNQKVEDAKNNTLNPFLEKIEALKTKFREFWNMPAMEKVKLTFESIAGYFTDMSPEKAETIYMWICRIVDLLTILTVRSTIAKIGEAAEACKEIANVFQGVKKDLENIGKKIEGVFDSLKGGIDKVFTSIEGVFNEVKTSIKVGMFKKIAISIAILAASLWVLSRIPKEDLQKAGIAMGALAFCLTVMYVIIQKASKVKLGEGEQLFGGGWSLLAMAAAMWILAGAISKFNKLSPEQILSGGATMVLLGVVFGWITKEFKDFDNNSLSLAATMFVFALTLGLIALEVSAIGILLPLIKRGGVAAAQIVVVLAAAIQAFRGLNVSPATIFLPLTLAVAVGVLALAVAAWGLISEKLLVAGAARAAVALLAISVASGLMSRLAGWTTIGDVLLPLSLTAAVMLMILAVCAWGLVSEALINNGLLRAVGAMLAITVCIGLMNFIGGGASSSVGDAAMALALALAIGLLVIAVVAIGKLTNEDTILNSMLVVAILMAVLSICIIAMSQFSTGLSVQAVLAPIAFVLAIGMLAAVVVALGLLLLMNETVILAGGFCVLLLAAALSGMAIALSHAKLNAAMVVAPLAFVIAITLLAAAAVVIGKIGGDAVWNGVGVIVVLGVLLMFAIEAFNQASDFNLKKLLIPLAMVAGIYALIYAVIKVGSIGDIGTVWSCVGVVVVLGVMLMATMAVFNSMKSFDLKMLLIPIVIIAALFAMVEAITVLGKMDSGEFEQGLIGVIAIFVGLAAGIYILAAAAPNLILIGNSFKQFGIGLAAVLIPFALAFALMTVALPKFAEAFSLFNETSLSSIGKGLIALAGAMVILGIAGKLLTGSAVGLIAVGALFIAIGLGAYLLVDALILLSENFDIVSETVGRVGVAMVAGIQAALKALLNFIISNLPIIIVAGAAIVLALASGIGLAPVLIIAAIAGILAYAFATFDGTLPEWIAAGGEAILSFLEGALAKLPDLVAGIGNAIGGAIDKVANWVAGDKDLENAGAEVDAKVADGLDKGSKDVTAAAIKTGDAATDGMLERLLSGILPVSDASDKLDLAAATALVNGGGDVSAAGESVGTGGVNALFGALLGGQTSVTDASGQLNMAAITGLYSNSGDVAAAGESAGTTSVEAICNSLFSGQSDVADASSLLSKATAEGFDTSELEGAFNINMDEITSQFPEYESYFKDGGTDFMGAMSGGITENSAALTDAFSEANTTAMDEMRATEEDWNETGKILIDATGKGVDKNGDNMSKKGAEYSKKGAKKIEDTKGKWKTAGENIMKGLIQGISNYEHKLNDKIAAINRKLKEITEKSQKIKSPSRVFRQYGQYIMQGLILGLSDLEESAYSTMSDINQNIIQTAKDPLAQLIDLMNSDMIDDPTITPVMDLSQIQNGTNRLYSMMADAERYNLTGAVDLAVSTSRSIDSASKRKQDAQTASFDALASAINSLQASLAATSGNTYNINGITYDDGSNISAAISALIRAARIGGRA